MIKKLKIIIITIIILTIWFILINANAQETTDIILEVTKWTLTITADGAINLWWITVTDIDTELSGQFSVDSFYVTDFKWSSSWFYTTIAITDLTGDVDGTEYTIPAANVEFKSNATTPNLITGTANAAVTLGSISTNYIAIDTPTTYFQRANGTIGGILSQYGDTPWIKVLVPAHQAPTAYHGTITYTLYEPGS